MRRLVVILLVGGFVVAAIAGGVMVLALKKMGALDPPAKVEPR